MDGKLAKTKQIFVLSVNIYFLVVDIIRISGLYKDIIDQTTASEINM